MSKHTQGPWEVVPHDSSEVCFEVMADGWFVATVHDGVMEESNAEFNARLIAAAPELLEALRDLRQRFHAACIAHGSDAWAADASCAKADEAIAKATGDQS